MSRLLLTVLGVVTLLALAAVSTVWRHMHAENQMMNRHGARAALAAIGAMFTTTDSMAAENVPPTVFGVSVVAPSYYRKSRIFANLAAVGSWARTDHQPLDTDTVDPQGNVKKVPPGTALARPISPPNVAVKSATIHCSWNGKADITAQGRTVTNVRAGPDYLTFDLQNETGEGDRISIGLKLSSTDPANPIRNIDCREAGMAADARFDPAFIESLRGFKIVRFMDWQQTNLNKPVTWVTRNLPSSATNSGGDGVAIEDMIALAKQVNADAWFNMPWNADDDYYERFARTVHDSLPANRTIYVELGNEVWNYGFKVAGQAKTEGVAAGLSANPYEAAGFRYAQRLAHVMDIWAKVYVDRPGRLVRVAGCQNGENCAKTVLGYADTARHIDALATAPYFGFSLNKTVFSSPDELFAAIDPDMDAAMARALKAKAVAAHYGKRYFAYEAGQHLIFKDVDLERRVQRDPRMYDAYKRYIDFWRTQIGDVIMLYSSSGPISRFGAWGLTEYVGQPLTDAPKMRAVHDEMIMVDRHNPAR